MLNDRWRCWPFKSAALLVLATLGTSFLVFTGVTVTGSADAATPSPPSYTPVASVTVLDTVHGGGAAKKPVGANSRTDIQVAGMGGIPTSGVTAVALQLAAPAPRPGTTYVTVYAAGTNRPATATLTLTGHPGAITALVPLGAGGKISIRNAGRAQHLLAAVVGYWAGAADLTTVRAIKVVDTVAGIGSPKAALKRGASLDMQINGVGGVPATGVSSVALQVTAPGKHRHAGALTLFAKGGVRPSPTLIFDKNAATTTAIVPVGPGGKVTVHNTGTRGVHVIIAVSGYWATKSELRTVTPALVLDTRTGVGAAKAKLARGASVDVPVTDRAGVPATGVKAVAVQVTAFRATKSRSLSVRAQGSVRPTVDTLFTGNRPESTTTIVPVGVGGRITISNEGGRLHVVASVIGYWTDPEPVVSAPTLTPMTTCTAGLGASIEGTPGVAFEGGSVTYAATVRNDPSGACLDVAGEAVMSGAVTVPGRSEGNSLTDIAVWLEVPRNDGSFTVLPAAAGLAAGAQCPGADLANCGSLRQPTYGQISYPLGPELPFATPLPISGAALHVPFRFFPTLAPEDLTALNDNNDARLAVSVTTTADGVQVVRTPVVSTTAPTATNTELKTTLPDTTTVTTSIGDVPAGQETTVEAGTYTVRVQDPDTITASTRATSGTVVSEVTTAQTSVILDDSGRAPLLPTASPSAVRSRVSTAVFFAVTPTFVPDGEITVLAPDGSVVGSLPDVGTDGDLVANDGSYGATYPVTLVGDTSYTVSAQRDGNTVTGTVTIHVAEIGEPIEVAPANTDDIYVTPTGQAVLRAQFLVTTVPDITFTQLQAAATLVNGTVIGRVDATSWQIGIPPMNGPADLDSVLEKVSSAPGVVGAEANTVSSSTDVTPNDPQYSSQWHLPYIHANQAWAFNRGDSPKLVVAVVDSGVRRSHEDLGNVTAGHDFVNNDDNADDDNHHGTHVAGTIGASSNNSRGVGGVSWNTSILPVKVMNAKGHGDDATIQAGVQWAVDHGARVINMSLGGAGRTETQAKYVDYAWDRGRLIVASAGNDNCTTKSYPAGFNRTEHFSSWFGLFGRDYDTELVSVGANDAQGNRSLWNQPNQPACAPNSGSNHGPWVDLAAPGTDILATWVVPVSPDNTTYSTSSGTSMAAPVVSGVAALVASRERNLSPGDLKVRLVSTTRALKTNQDIGTGSIDAFGATFNGGFEAGIATWTVSGTATAVSSLGPIKPRMGSKMGYLSSGPGGAVATSSLTKKVNIDSTVLKNGRLRFTFEYNYLSEEYPEFVGSTFNDDFAAKVVVPSTGATFPIATESVNGTTFSKVSGIDFLGGDSTVGQSGWRTAKVDIGADQLGSSTSIDLVVSDRGDAVFDSVVLLDNFQVQ